MSKKLESSFLNMVLVLFAITLIASVAVGYVQMLTAEPIKKAKEEKQTQAIREVIPGEFNNNPTEKPTIIEKDGGQIEIYDATKDGKLIGKAVKTFTNNGFAGKIAIMVGFYPNGKIFNYAILEAQETPGLGTKMSFWFQKGNKGDITGLNPAEKTLTVSKDGGNVDAITAATITSRAFLDAINRAASVIGQTKADTSTGATKQKNKQKANEYKEKK